MNSVALSLGRDWPVTATVVPAGCEDGRILLCVDSGPSSTIVRLSRAEAVELAAQIMAIAEGGTPALLRRAA